MGNDELDLPLLKELEKGPWPGFIQEYKKMVKKGNEMAKRILLQLEKSYEDRRTYWKHGGAVTVRGYGGGVIGRYSEIPDIGPDRGSHTFRVAQPAAWFYNTKKLRQLCDLWEKYGSGLMNLHGSTGDIILLGISSDVFQECFDKMTEEVGFDLGGSGSDIRSLSCCMGPALCEYACFDTLDLYDFLTRKYQEEIHRPMFPYKFKIKISGCPNDCVASMARADMPVIGTWRDEIQIDQDAVREYAKNGVDINHIVRNCPTKCMKWDGHTLEINNEECVRCMYCINKLPKALKPGKDRGATIMLGGKATFVQSAFLAWVLVPFMKIEKPYTELTDLIDRLLDWFDENAKIRERISEAVYRIGMDRFLKDIGLDAAPQMVYRPRSNPFVYWSPDELEKLKEKWKEVMG